jgi:uncharacterized protein YndB with AHSA1/START domain
MTGSSTSIDIQAPPERVWEVLKNIEHWPEWTPSMINIERLDAGPLTINSRARVRQPRLLPAVWQVTELIPPRSFTWITRSPGVHITAGQVIEPVADGSRVTLSVDFSGLLAPVIARLTRSLTERYMGLEAIALKRRSESSS